MARTINRLTARHVTTLGAGLHADGGGLYLRIEPSGARRWVFIFHWQRKRTEMGLGSSVAVSLASARTAAQEAREQVQAGKNPVEERRRVRAAESAVTFGEFADMMIEDLGPQWKSAVHRRQWETSMTVDAAALRDKHPATITTEDVIGVLKPIWLVKPESASRLRGRIERVLDGAKVKGLRTGENPARWRGHLSLLLPTRQAASRGHHPAMPIDDVPAFMKELRRAEGVTARALEFTILTATRTGEAIAAKSEEFTLEQGAWTIPGIRMKAKVEHRVALSDRAKEIAADLMPDAGFVFPGRGVNRHLSNMAMLNLLNRMGYGAYTVHGFRSTFKDWASERTSFPDELSEEALAHRVGSKVRRAYRRGDALEKRRQLMQAWADFCGAAVASNVISLSA